MAELTDETIKKLNESIDKLSRNVGTGGISSKSSGDDGSRLKDLGKATIDSTATLVKFGGTLMSSNARLSDGYKAATDIVGNFGSALIDNNSVIGKAMSGVNEFGEAVIKSAEAGVDTFRTLSSSGASFNNNILQMKNSAAQSRLTLDEFAGIVSNNTKGFAAFGGTVTKGAKVFTDASKDLFDQGLATPLLNMGMTFEEVNEDLAEYIVANRRRFTADQIAAGAANASFAKMSTEMDKVAKLTGQNRKELEKETNDRMRKGQVDAKIRMLEASGNKEAADKMKLALAQAAKAGPGALAAVEDLFTKGAVVSEEGRQAAVSLGPAFKDLTNMVSYAKGPGGVEGMTSSISNFNEAVSQRINDPNFLRIATLGGMGNATADAAAQMVQSAGTYADNVKALMNKEGLSRAEAVKKLSEMADKEQKARDPVTSTVVNGEKALRDLGAVINEKLLGTDGEITKFADGLKGASTYLETLNRPEMTNSVDEFVKKVSTVSSLATGNKEMPDPNKSAVDIELLKAQQAKMDAIIKGLATIPDSKLQKSEASDLATLFSSEMGPALLDYLTAAAEQENKTVEGLIAEMVQGGSKTQIRDMAATLKKQLDPNANVDDMMKSLDAAKNLPLEELLKNASSVVKEMTVIKMNIPGKEFGGPVQKDQAYVVGEKRAELFVPRENGYIVPSIKNLESSMKQIKKPMQQQMQSIDTSGLEASMREFATNMQSALQKSGAQDQMKEIAEQISNSMGNVTGELIKGNKVAARQLKGIGGLSGNLFKGLG